MIRKIGVKILSRPQSYLKMVHIQEYLVSKKSNVLLLLEHRATYTVGRQIQEGTIDPNQIAEKKRLLALGAEFYHSRRGGQITFHGPGQLVGYPIIDLGRVGLGVREYVAKLEHVLISTCSDFELSAKTTDDTGVWIENRKIAAIGIQVQRRITSHGFAINCDIDLAWFDRIVACGLQGKGVTSLSAESQKKISVSDAVPRLLKNFGGEFSAEMVNLRELDANLDAEIDMIINEEIQDYK